MSVLMFLIKSYYHKHEDDRLSLVLIKPIKRVKMEEKETTMSMKVLLTQTHADI